METATMEPPRKPRSTKVSAAAQAAAPAPESKPDRVLNTDPMIQPFKKNDLPHGTLPVHTYSQLKMFVDKWVSGELDDTLIIIGAAGCGKSEQVKKALRGNPHCYLKGQATKYGVYLELIKHTDEPVILDDVDTLLASREVTGLLKMLLETSSPKLVQWTTATTLLGETVPASFTTNSRTLILANELSQVSKNFAAVLDRSTILWFAPSAESLHEYAGTWCKDKEVYKYVGERIGATPSPSCRYYYHGVKWKQAQLDWKAMLNGMMLPPESEALLMKELQVKYGLAKDRVAAWKKETGKSEQSYWATLRAVNLKVGKISERGRKISEAMKRKHAARKAGEEGQG